METTINEALRIMNGHDWYWRMADYGYSQYFDEAKATMKHFVKVVSEIANPVVREALRNLWTLHYDYAKANCNGDKFEGFEEKESELMNVINS